MLVIYYSPGARGDFLSRVLEDRINEETQFRSRPAMYTKFHQFDDVNAFYQSRIESYNIRIHTDTAEELIDTTLLHFIKNKKQLINDNFYDLLFISAKHIFIDNQQSKYLNYSYNINFSDFYNLDIMLDLYANYTNKELSPKHIDFILKNNHLNSEYLESVYKDNKIIKTLKLFEFELACNLLFKTRLFNFDDYLLSENYESYMTLTNYIDDYRLQ